MSTSAPEQAVSSTTCAYPIVSALDKADDVIGIGRVWNSVNTEQSEFLPIFEKTREEARLLKDIKSMASRDAEKINEFLAKEGFQIKLDPFTEPTDFGTASVLDVLVEWLIEGKKVQIIQNGDINKVFPAVKLMQGVSFAKAKQHPNPIAVIETKSGDRVCMTVHDPLENFALLERASELSKSMLGIGGYQGALFPQVDLDQMVDISWLKKLWTTGSDKYRYEVAQALQQTKFRMNEKGARAQSGVAIGIVRTTSIMPKPVQPLVIDKPFLLWVWRAGLHLPLFTGWINEANWKIPKDISIK
jgi:hypothetical protein